MGYPLSKQCNRVWGVLEGEAEKDNPDLTLLAGHFTHSEPKLNTQILLLIRSRFVFVQNSLKYKYFPPRESFFLLFSDIISWTCDLDSPEDFLQLHLFAFLWFVTGVVVLDYVTKSVIGYLRILPAKGWSCPQDDGMGPAGIPVPVSGFL